MTAAGYRVAPARLDAAAAELGGRADALAAAQAAVAGEKVPAEAFGHVSESASAAATFAKTMSELGEKLGEHVKRTRTIQSGLAGCAAGYRRLDAQVAAMYRALMPEDPLPRAGNPAGVGGSADTGTWAKAIAANHTRVSDALTTEREHLTHLTDATDIARSKARIALYEDILANNRQILRFDPAGNGRIAELVGHLEPGTRNVGLFVPGVNTRLDNFGGYADLGRSLVAADPSGRTAMVVWADGVFPQSLLTEAPSPALADAMAPGLKAFTDELHGQIATHTDGNVMLTAIPHSYGASVFGSAEQLGLGVDRVVYVEGAGVGHGVWSPSDLPASQAGIQRYSMTAPGDPIDIAQGNLLARWAGYGHGADPDTFSGVTELETGRDASGHVLAGLPAHSDVLKPGSDSWTTIYRVLTSGEVTPKTAPSPWDTPLGVIP